ncbi:unnamed protein product [Spirodela intermedia]|uniref:Protein kinase domain-containing protein n=1 Tax=Spirodela intermedia TaxID=51605 RepID=A0A7I8KGW2_SPIIN|nr:unnamed protein product [Spirodela intermedia]
MAAEGQEVCSTAGERVDAAGTGRMVVVAVKMDAQSRELLTWALVKVAEPGDRVIALHVLLTGGDRSNREGNYGSCSSLFSLVKSFESILAVYEGFCNLKQIELKLKVCRGSSLRKSLVRETSDLPAAKLILGVTKNNRAIGSSTSVARYCAKKLSRECSVMAVNNGKIVFQRETAPSFIWQTRGNIPAGFPPEACRSSDCEAVSTPSPAPRGRGVKKGRSLSLPCDIDKYEISSSSCFEGSPKSSCFDGESPDILPEEEESAGATESVAYPHSPAAEGPPERRPGWHRPRRWPPLQRTGSEKSMISTFQRALRLPLRHSASATIHPDRKPVKPLSNPPTNVGGDGGGGLVSPVGRDSSLPTTRPAKGKPGRLPKDLETLHLKYSSTCRLFSYLQLATATSDFSAERLVGKGGSSRVYKGRLSDGEEFAVKILKQSEDALREFLLEVEIITTLRHKNIISLSGFCFENENLVLVYDFLPRGSLEDNLHGNDHEKASFGWAQRFKVAMGVADALNYLHGAGKPVIHRDVKSSNILLSDDYEPRLADFGLAQWESSSSSHAPCSDVAGTFGYLAPEYFMYGKVDEKIDVYAFGVVLLELLTGRKPINAVSPKRQESLVTWAKPFLGNDQATGLLDSSLGDQYDQQEAERTILAASLCIRRAPQSRPRMALVLKLLQGDEDIVKWAKLQVGGSSEEGGGLDEEDEETTPTATIRSHLSLALLDVDDDSMSISSTEHAVDFIMAHGSLEDYFQRRGSRSSSFD